MSFNEMSGIMGMECVSDAHQTQIKGTLETLLLRNSTKETEITDLSEGLMRMVDYINELSPQCLPDFRPESHKIDHLRKAVTELQNCIRV